jgi:hypothetical protein
MCIVPILQSPFLVLNHALLFAGRELNDKTMFADQVGRNFGSRSPCCANLAVWQATIELRLVNKNLSVREKEFLLAKQVRMFS